MKEFGLYVTILFSLVSCAKVDYYPDVSIAMEQVDIAHRGGRNQYHRENTLAGCKAALEIYDGVEVDIQISKDRTIWLSHEVDVFGCKGSQGCFPEISDNEIASVDSCDGVSMQYSRLEDLISWMSQNCPEKYLCVDLMGWIPCSGNSLGIDGLMRLEAEIVAKLANKYNFGHRILIETETISTLLWARKFSHNIGLYLNNYGDLEKGLLMALNYQLQGISFKTKVGDNLTTEMVQLYHRKGLRIIAWNIHSEGELSALRSMGVDFLQYDIP